MSERDPALLDGAIAPAENTELFGHAEAEEFLAQSYSSGKGHHAVLIEGPEGIGKATLAFRFAAHVLKYPDESMAPGQLERPDPDSAIMRQMASGASHNVMHIARPVDAKTGKMKKSITVDEVRRLGKFFSQTSGTGNWRIAIIDPADDMNRSAANAILKILEEPPKRSMLLLLAHSPGKLLPTIRSRCMRLTLAPLDNPAMMQVMSHLGIRLGDDQQDAILGAAGGSVAKALKLVNYGGFDIVKEFDDLLAAKGPAQRKAMHKLADVLSGRESEVIYEFFISHVEEQLVIRAREAALGGELGAADRLAKLSTDIGERVSISEGYNLDRKQTIISILESIA